MSKIAVTRRLFGTAALMLLPIVGAMIGGLYYGPILRSGQVALASWVPFTLIAAALASGVWWILGKRRATALFFLWTLLGGALSTAILCFLAAGTMPAFRASTESAPPAGPREPLAILTALDLYWGQSRTLATLDKAFEIDRLDAISPQSLAMHDRLLLAQPRLLKPEELVALDRWIRDGGRAVILADPLLVWPTDLVSGDRRRPPVTSLLDPLLTHWGLTLEAAPDMATQRQFTDGGRLLIMSGASRFTVRHSDFARCQMVGIGWSTTCRIGKGKVRLIADADILDERIWQAPDDGFLVGDNMALIDQWLRRPHAPAIGWSGAPTWTQGNQAVVGGFRWALLTGGLWAILGAMLILHLERTKSGPNKRKNRKEQVQNNVSSKGYLKVKNHL